MQLQWDRALEHPSDFRAKEPVHGNFDIILDFFFTRLSRPNPPRTHRMTCSLHIVVFLSVQGGVGAIGAYNPMLCVFHVFCRSFNCNDPARLAPSLCIDCVDVGLTTDPLPCATNTTM